MPWLRMKYKGKQKAYVLVDQDANPVEERGRAKIRFKLNDPREYSAKLDQLAPLPDESPQDPPVPEALPPRKKTTRKKASSAEATKIPDQAPKGVILAFTDGACRGNPGPAGSGVVLLFGEHRKEIAHPLGTSTNNIAELTAIELVLDAVKKPTLPVQIFTDSSYSIGVLTKGWKAKKNGELIARIREKIGRFPNLQLMKVKGHAGHPLNERADELACLAADEQRASTTLNGEPTSGD